jgi:hypothetical protein
MLQGVPLHMGFIVKNPSKRSVRRGGETGLDLAPIENPNIVGKSNPNF